MKYAVLGNTGLTVSQLSFGASSLGSVFHDTDEAESIQVVHKALKSGINYIDTAPWYGHGKSETVLSKALQGVPRQAYYLSTKVCRYEADVHKMFDFSAERTLRSVDESLARLGLSYVDIIQVHDMEFAPSLDIVVNETLPALQKVKDSGKAKFIGITGYPLGNFRKVIEQSPVKIDTILTYCHGSMNDNSLQDELPYFHERGVGVINASPISMGLLSHRGPPAWHPATQDIKEVCRQAAEYCKSKGADISRLAMHFTLNQPGVPTTLVSTASQANLDRNLRAVYEELTSEEKETLEYICERYFKPLNNKTWEGVEVENYNKQKKGTGTGTLG
uniref:NADP-dependent oxidoreductase domain-containing protein n=1 Tax=Branchiostoma floridae TaxID=7739 RepID=C3YBR4_BRAFL|eukprot:XP_002606411.1 hypothetical protein BRAFLDRAFT_67662 [Branchiostoma floridae]